LKLPEYTLKCFISAGKTGSMEILTTKKLGECLTDLFQLLPWKDTVTGVERLREPPRQLKDRIGRLYKVVALRVCVNGGNRVNMVTGSPFAQERRHGLSNTRSV
jgi:hypothetical protein